MRARIDIAILLLPALAALLLWQSAGASRLRPAALAGPDLLSGFADPEQSPAGPFRWGGADARLQLPAGGLPGLLMLRGAVAPGAHVSVILGGASAVALPPAGAAPQLRRYLLLVPARPDALGWAALSLTARPPARLDGRALGMALYEAAILPVSRGPRWPPALAWAIIALAPALLALALALSGAPRRPAVIAAALAGLGLAGLWSARPASLYPALLDLRAFLAEPLVWGWWLLAQIAGLAAAPLAARLLRGLPLAGYPLAKPLGLLLIAWAAWLLSVAGLAPFDSPAVLAVAAALAAAAWAPHLLHRERPALPAPAGLIAYELLFAGGLLFGLWLRWHGAGGPALTGTEKPMELAILNAALRYPRFPPLDPWLAGYGLNYYYLGYVLVAGLARLSGAPAALAFNLGFALVAALTVVGVAYAAHALVALSPGPAGRRPGRAARVGVAALALLFCLGLGSQASALQLAVGSPLVRALDAGQLASALAQRLAGADRIWLGRPTPPSWDGPPFDSIAPAAGPSYDWFMPSRAIYDDVALPSGGVERRYAISEFPAFSLYLGDLHPHILAMPFTLLALAVALALAARSGRSRLQLIFAGLIVGCLYCINAWDAPTYALLCAGGLALSARSARPGRAIWRALAADLALLALAALLAALPFLLTFRPPAGPVPAAVAGVPILGRLAATLGLAANHTRLHSFLLVFGLFLLPVLALLLPPALRAPSRPSQIVLGRHPSRPFARFADTLRGPWRPSWIIALALPLGLWLDFPLLFLLPLAALLARRAWAADRPGESFVAWAAAVGCLLLLAPELVYIRDHLEGQMSRMITIFKCVYQAWMIWGVAAAYAVWARLRPGARRRADIAWAAPAALLLAGALVYPLGLLAWAAPWRPAERTLDGLAFLARERPAELAAARWLAANVAPAQVVLTGFCNCDYEQVGRAAAISGAQTVIGWMDGHERVWRSGYPEQLADIAARERDVPAIYAATDIAAARALLARYGVGYIYLGPTERRLHGQSGAALFARHFPVVFAQGDITIYRVTP
jgi:YYY domain-containing protein